MLVIAFCFLIYYLVDFVWNGSFVNWFEWHFMTTTDKFLPEVGETVVVHEPIWYKVKRLLIVLCIGIIVFGAIVAYIISHFIAKAERRKAITDVSKILRDYMAEGTNYDVSIPREYAEISAQMAEIKSAMLRGEQALRKEAAQKNDLVAYLAHDLKTPLTSVIGYLSLLDEAPDMPESQKARFTHIALDKAYRLEGLVNEFFEITRFNLQEIKLQKENIDLYYMLVQMMDEFYPILSAKGNTATLQANESLTAYGDPVKLARVFNNILKNAAAYSTSNTEILISAKQEEGRVIVSIQNHGPTIPAEKLAAIFEKFYRMDEARTSNTGGAGLGLAIAKEIVLAHGGTITAQSINEITTFTVTLPLAD